MIPLIKPDLQYDEVAQGIKDVIDSGQLTSGKNVAEFEKKFAEYVGVKYAITTTSATTALHMALVARGIGPGDEVLVSDFTFPASGNAIIQCGAIPVLVDCMEGRFDLNFEDARKKISERTKAIMVVHPFGQPVSYDRLSAFAEETGLWVLEDAACAISSHSNGVKCGAMGDAACFSFHPRKILTTGEGGMITTNDDALYEKVTILRSHGGSRSEVGFSFVENGYNYRMSEIQAVLGLEQLNRIDEIVEERRRIARLYIEAFKDMPEISIPLITDEKGCSFQSFVILLDDKIDRNRVIAKMREQGIETMLGTYAMHTHPAFSEFSGSMPHALRAQDKSLTLPLYAGMEREDILHIVGKLKKTI